ncbi:MAG: TIGR02147 family protein [Pseudobdellovibrionaceae bacterium]
MLNIFEFISYRKYLDAWIESKGDRSYGLKGRIAKALGISSSLLSQILKGEKSLTPDQSSELCDYLGLNELESDYFHLLVEKERAASPRYREKIERKLHALRQQSQKIGKRVPRNKELTDEQKAIYYSSWLFTGIRNMVAVPGFQNPEAIAEHLNCDSHVVNRILRFLLENSLCLENEGKLTYGPASIHVDKESPFVNKHHQNWRFQALQNMERKREEDIFFTSPMSLSVEAAEEVRKLIPNFIQTVMKLVGPSASEKVMCLNLDWFQY